MPNTEEKAVLNIDSSQTLTRLAHALTLYARIIPGAAVAKVTFTLVPFVNIEQDEWRAAITLICTGELKRTEEPSAENNFLEGVKPIEVFRQTWEGLGSGCEGAIEDLGSTLDEFLARTITRRREELDALGEALTALANPVNLQDMWATEDRHDDSPQE